MSSPTDDLVLVQSYFKKKLPSFPITRAKSVGENKVLVMVEGQPDHVTKSYDAVYKEWALSHMYNNVVHMSPDKRLMCLQFQ